MDILSQIALSLFSILPGNYSGITHVDGNTYAVVDDKRSSESFRLMTLDIDSITGKIKNATMNSVGEGIGMQRDAEGVAYCRQTNTIFVSGEEDQRIIEYNLSGNLTGREFHIPEMMNRHGIRGNLGFEALTYNESTERFWTTTEATLNNDGEVTTLAKKDCANKLRLTCFDLSLNAIAQYAYKMDLPTVKKDKGQYAFGVPSMLAMDNGDIVVMERELFIGKNKLGSFCKIKLYKVSPNDTSRVDGMTSLKECDEALFLRKELLGEFTTRLRVGKMNLANYEGMCLGPRLSDGRQTIIIIADSQNGAGNKLFHLKDYIRVVVI